ncbi:MAG: hypothetical protein Q4F84_08680, partial [Fibrobacter sp.]|nr:hypothetical protein [Fibrobacter sp.]
TDTVKLYIKAGEARQLVLEGSPNWQNSKNKANPIPQVEITSNMTTANVYAILRDSIGNYVDYSKLTDWDVLENNTSISVRNGNANVGEGVIVRDEDTKTDTAKVVAIDRTTGLLDTVDVILLEYYYTQLRIVLKKPEFSDADSVTMTTNDDTTLFVQGLRSDNNQWADVSAEWECSQNLKISPLAPGWSHYWEFSPSDTGTGWIRVTLGNDTVTTPDTVQVKFLQGPPTRVTIEIITPPENRRAGDSIITVIKIYNEDGLVPGEYCFENVKFSDKLGDGGRPRPFVLLGVDTLWLDSTGTDMCFNDGVDTVPLTLFYVPYKAPDSLHQ